MFIKSLIAFFVSCFISFTAVAQTNDILFAGSSTIAIWNVEQAFPNFNSINIGRSGTLYADVLKQIDSQIIPSGASRIVLYSGDNDLYSGLSAEQVFGMVQQVVESIHEQLPDSQIFVISIKPSPDRRFMIPEIKRANAFIEEYSRGKDYFVYVDLFSHMIDSDGEPLSHLFITDGLHLSGSGYALWTSVLTAYL